MYDLNTSQILWFTFLAHEVSLLAAVRPRPATVVSTEVSTVVAVIGFISLPSWKQFPQGNNMTYCTEFLRFTKRIIGKLHRRHGSRSCSLFWVGCYLKKIAYDSAIKNAKKLTGAGLRVGAVFSYRPRSYYFLYLKDRTFTSVIWVRPVYPTPVSATAIGCCTFTTAASQGDPNIAKVVAFRPVEQWEHAHIECVITTLICRQTNESQLAKCDWYHVT